MPEMPPQTDLSEQLRHSLRERWQQGEQVSAEQLLASAPADSIHDELILDLLYEEHCLRQEYRVPLSAEDYQARFPHLSSSLRDLFDLESMMESGGIEQAFSQAVTPTMALNQLQEPTDSVQSDVTPLAPASREALLGIGTELGEYVIQATLGQGGMGQVFKALHRRMKRTVAIKVLAPHLLRSPDALNRFQREVEAAAQLSHSNIVTAFDAREDAGVRYLVTEYIDGDNLSDRVRRQGPLSVIEAVRITSHAAEALGYAHANGLIHRDVKPANLMVDRQGRFKLLDLGLARNLADQTDPAAHQLTGSGAVLGTVDFLAPEQAQDTHGADARADIYGLGCTLYFLLTGQVPFPGQSMVDKLVAHRFSPPPSLATLRDDVPAELDQLVQRMMAKRPEDRHPTMADVIADLQRVGAPTTLVSTHATSATIGLDLIADPTVVTNTSAAPQGTVAPAASSSRRPPVIRKLLLAGMGAIFAWAFWQIIIVRDNDGNEVARIKVPEGGKVEVQGPDDPKRATTYTNKLGMKFAIVPKGVAWLGGSGGKPGTQKFEVRNDFYLGQYEVTQGEWERVMGTRPSVFSRDGAKRELVREISDNDLKQFPVESVSWDEAQEFIRRLNAQLNESGWTYRLPFQDEWEYACRGGPMANASGSGFDFYLDQPYLELKPKQANFAFGEQTQRPCKVGSFAPNKLGLYDMHGNVMEWCEDGENGTTPDARAHRGGLWLHPPKSGRASDRYRSTPTNFFAGHIGLRLARVVRTSQNPTGQIADLAWQPIPVGESPFDKLDPAAIPAEERFAFQPKELIAVLGSHHRRQWHGSRWIAWSPDGNWLASISSLSHGTETQAYLWDARTRKLARLIENVGNAPVCGCAFTPDSKRLAIAAHNGIRLYDLTSDTPGYVPWCGPKGPEVIPVGHAFALQFSRDGKTLAGAIHVDNYKSGEVRLWDLSGEQPRLRHTLKCDGFGSHSCAPFDMTPDAKTFAYGSRKTADKPHRVIVVDCDGETIKERTAVENADLEAGGCALTPDGKKLAVAWNHAKEYSIYDVTRTPARIEVSLPDKLSQGTQYLARFSTDGRSLAISGSNSIVVYAPFDKRNGPSTGLRLPDESNSFAFAPHRSELAASNGQTVRFYDFSNDQLKEIDPPQPRIARVPVDLRHTLGISFLSSASGLLVTQRDDAMAQLWDLSARAPRPWSGATPTDLGKGRPILSRDGESLLLLTQPARQIDFGADKILKSQVVEIRDARMESFLNHKRHGLIQLSEKGKPGPWALWQAGQPLTSAIPLTGLPADPVYTAVSADGRWIASVGPRSKPDWEHSIELWSVEKGVVQLRTKLKTVCHYPTFSPDGRLLVGNSADRPLLAYDLSGPEPQTIPAPKGWRNRSCAPAFTPDGKLLVVGGDYGWVEAWDTITWTKVWETKLPGMVAQVIVADDGRHLFTCNGNGTVYVLRVPGLTPPPSGTVGPSSLFIHNSAFPQWLKDVQAMPAEKQLEAVARKLIELNPKFDGKMASDHTGTGVPKIENGVVTHLQLFTDHVTDLSPVQALAGLKSFACPGSQPGKGRLSDLSPLRGVKLASLDCYNTRVSDLSPLLGMPLTNLNIGNTPVATLTPIAGIALTRLSMNDCRISDLSPLREMPLIHLACAMTDVSDLTPLEQCRTLSNLVITRTKVTPDAIAALQKALPDCMITSDNAEPPPEEMPELMGQEELPDWKFAPGAPAPAIVPFDAQAAAKHQADWAKFLNMPVDLENKLGMKFRLIPPGEFETTNSQGQPRKVRVTKPYYLGATEVTVGQFRAFVNETKYVTEAEHQGQGYDSLFENKLVPKVCWHNPGYPFDDNTPVTLISSADALAYCAWLSNKEQATYQVPQEHYWEFGARAGALGGRGAYPVQDASKLSWFRDNLPGPKAGPQGVGQKTSNNFGLVDCLGNVSEWCRQGPPYVPSHDPSFNFVTRGAHVLYNGDQASKIAMRLRYGEMLSASVRGIRLLRLVEPGNQGPFNEPLLLRRGEPMGPTALVSQPTAIQGLRSWSVEMRRPLSSGLGYSSLYGSLQLAWSPDGQWLAAAEGMSNQVRIHDARGNVQRILAGISRTVAVVAWSKDKTWLAASDADYVYLFDTLTWTCRFKIKSGSARQLVFSPDSRNLLIASGQFPVMMVDLKSAAKRDVIMGSYNSAAWSPDSNRFALGSNDAHIRIFGASTLKELVKWKASSGNPIVNVLGWIDANRLAAQPEDGVLQVWNVETQQSEQTHKIAKVSPTLSDWSPNRDAAILYQGANSAFHWDLLSPPRIFIKGIGLGVAWSPDGATLATRDPRGLLQFRDAKTGEIIHTGPEPGRAALTGDPWQASLFGKEALLVARNDLNVGSMVLDAWDAKTGRPLKRGTPIPAPNIAPSPDGGRLLCWSDKQLCLLDGVSGKTLHAFPPLAKKLQGVRWSYDNQRFATWDEELAIRIWNAETRKEELALKGHTVAIHRVAWSPDGAAIVSFGAEPAMRIWKLSDPEKPEVITEFPDKTVTGKWSPTSEIVWTPDGKKIVARAERLIAWIVEKRTWALVGPIESGTGSHYLAPTGRIGFQRGQWNTRFNFLDTGEEYKVGYAFDDQASAVNSTVAIDPAGRRAMIGPFAFDLAARKRGGTLLPSVGENEWLCVGPTGHYRGGRFDQSGDGTTAAIELHLVYVAQTDAGEFITLNPAEFQKRFGWKNDPQQASLCE